MITQSKSTERICKSPLRGPVRTLAISVLPLFFASLQACGSPPEPIEGGTRPQAVTIPGTEVHPLSSAIRGRDYQISVALPLSYGATDSEYPVIYMLDADFAMGMGTELARMLAFGSEVQEAVLVGIGYGNVSPEEWGQLRTVDLTPSVDLGYEGTLREQNPTAPEILSGEASDFLRFLVEEVRPFVESRYRIAEDGRGIFGDSLGGLFCLFTLFHAPESFDRYIVGSPSIWWDNEVTLEFEETYAASHTDLAAEVFMSVGLLEEDPNEPLSASSAMVTNVRNLNATLVDRAYPNLHLTTHFFEGETHLSVIPSNLGWGLRALFPGRGRPGEG